MQHLCLCLLVYWLPRYSFLGTHATILKCFLSKASFVKNQIYWEIYVAHQVQCWGQRLVSMDNENALSCHDILCETHIKSCHVITYITHTKQQNSLCYFLSSWWCCEGHWTNVFWSSEQHTGLAHFKLHQTWILYLDGLDLEMEANEREHQAFQVIKMDLTVKKNTSQVSLCFQTCTR